MLSFFRSTSAELLTLSSRNLSKQLRTSKSKRRVQSPIIECKVRRVSRIVKNCNLGYFLLAIFDIFSKEIGKTFSNCQEWQKSSNSKYLMLFTTKLD